MRSQVAMDSFVEIGDYQFRNRLHSAEIFSSWKTLTDTATLKIPNLQDANGSKLEKLIKVGDPVVIKFGYDNELYTEFEGYVSEGIIPGAPLEIKCEDEMWMMKQKLVNKSWRSIKLKDMLHEILPSGSVIECPDVTLAPFRIERASVARALEILKQDFMLVAYFRNKKLYVGLAYQEKGLGEVNYHFQQNAIMGDLAFRRKEDVRIKVKAISVLPNNKKIEIEVGDGALDENGRITNIASVDADQVTLHYFNKTKEELKALATEAINRMKYDGYRGSFKGKGIPRPIHGMVANLMDDKYPERTGGYFIDSVKTTYNGDGGFNRDNELGRSATSPLIEA